MVRRWVTAVAVALVTLGLLSVWVGYASRTPPARPVQQQGPLVVVGMPELEWTQVSAARTPSLWPLLDVAATGAVSVRATTTPTCTPDAWLSLSAGNGAQVGCAPGQPRVTGSTASWPHWADWSRTNRDARSPSTIGLLAAQLNAHHSCVGAVGAGAALAAADRDGTVSHYWPRLTGADLTTCGVTFVDLGAADGGARADASAALEDVFTDLPSDATVIITGLSDGHQPTPVLRSLVMAGPGVPRGRISSASTHQVGFAQASDITATALSRTDADLPGDVAGQPLSVVPSSAPVPSLVRQNQDLTEALRQEHRMLHPFAYGMTVLYAGAALAIFLAWRRQRGLPEWVRPLGVYLASLPVASFLINLLPWWRGGPVALWLFGGIAALAGAVTGVAMLGPWRRWTGGPAIVVAAVTLLVMALDVMHGTQLQLLAMQGLQPAYGGRYYGMGNAGFGMFASAAVLLGGLVAVRQMWWDDTEEIDRRLAAGSIVVVGLVALVIDGWPSWGADFGGPPALLTATALLALLALRVRITWRLLLMVAVAVVVVAAGLAVLDWLRPSASRTHLGRFVQQVIDGDGGQIVGSKLGQNLDLLIGQPLNLLVPVGVIVGIIAVARPDTRVGRPLVPLWEEVPFLREVVIALLVCWVVAFALNDSGVAVPATGAQVAVPLLFAVAGHAFAVRDRRSDESR